MEKRSQKLECKKEKDEVRNDMQEQCLAETREIEKSIKNK